jgi:hypothetical protein
MAGASKLMLILARMNPAMYDALIPHSHFNAQPHVAAMALTKASASPGEEVMLNPQPLPPADAFLAASAEVAHDIARAAIAAEVSGGSARGIVSSAIDEWCGTPRPWPWPWPWPGPSSVDGGDPEPHPEWDFDASRLVGSLTLASVAARMKDGEARIAIEQGAEQLLDAALAAEVMAPSH